jgi:hypothetical protein
MFKRTANALYQRFFPDVNSSAWQCVNLPAHHGVVAAGWLAGCDAPLPLGAFHLQVRCDSVSAICYHGVEIKMKPGRNETVKLYLQLNTADQRQTP